MVEKFLGVLPHLLFLAAQYDGDKEFYFPAVLQLPGSDLLPWYFLFSPQWRLYSFSAVRSSYSIVPSHVELFQG